MDKKILVLASSNLGKIKEFQKLFPNHQIMSARSMGFTGIIVEDGETFYDNALIKAQTVYEALKMPVIADDSGLCVSCLNGAPGVHSARYSDEETDEANNKKLLEEMENSNYRNAKYVCCLVYISEDGAIHSSIGECTGKILRAAVGSNGFGYDPLFLSDDLGKSFGEVLQAEKDTCSHRARAVEILKKNTDL